MVNNGQRTVVEQQRSEDFVLYPAIDMIDGKCVRLLHGDFAQATVYHTDPVAMAQSFAAQGAQWIHVVDLDAAKRGHLVHTGIVEQIVRHTGLRVQYGGGIRTKAHVETLRGIGVERCIVGTAATHDTTWMTDVLATDPTGVAIGIDTRNGYVATQGWVETTQWQAVELARRWKSCGVNTFVFTDIATDGALQGPNVEALVAFAKGNPWHVIASGGVSSVADVLRLHALRHHGICGAIVGRAIYTGDMDLRAAFDALARVQEGAT